MSRQVNAVYEDLIKFRDVNKARPTQTCETKGRTALINEIEKILADAQPHDKTYQRVLSLLAAQTFHIPNPEKRKLPIKITNDKQYPNFGPFFAQFTGARFGNLLYELAGAMLSELKSSEQLDSNHPFFDQD
jgi:hypothetical protein